MGKTPVLASPGKAVTLKPSDTWACPCGEVNSLGSWVAAHWDFELIHTCNCGVVRTLFNGRLEEQ